MKQTNSLRTSLLLAVATLFIVTLTLAAPEYVIVVNHSTKECIHMYAGDECQNCSPVEGWQILEGAVSLEDCPADYSIVEDASLYRRCVPIETTGCCSTPHTGSNGDCRNVIINRTAEECAFVDVNACPRLSEGWEMHRTLCPFGYTWVTGIECLRGNSGDSAQDDSSLIENDLVEADFAGLALAGVILAVSVLAILGILVRRKRVQE
jgi:hypothetical protein